jgi:hypothetical protein
VLDREAVAPTDNFLGVIDGIALDNGLEVNRVVHIDAVKADIVDMHRIVKGTFEDYGLGSGASGAAHGKA